MVSVVEIATVFEDYTTEEQHSVVRLLCAKGLDAKDIHKEIFPVYDGKFLLRKAVHNLVEKFSQGRSKVADDARPGAKWLRQQSNENFCAAGSSALIKQWDNCIHVGGGYVEK
jgi:hypothetical protein